MLLFHSWSSFSPNSNLKLKYTEERGGKVREREANTFRCLARTATAVWLIFSAHEGWPCGENKQSMMGVCRVLTSRARREVVHPQTPAWWALAPAPRLSALYLPPSVFTSLSQKGLVRISVWTSISICNILHCSTPEDTGNSDSQSDEEPALPIRLDCRQKGPWAQNRCCLVGKSVSCGHRKTRTYILYLPLGGGMTFLDFWASDLFWPQFTYQ